MGKIFGWTLCSPTTTSRRFFFKCGESSVSLYGDSAMVLPACLLSSGFGSKVSIWLAPPTMKSQMTLLALGAKCGLPSGGAHLAAVSARAMPSRCSMAPSARPVNPMPTSARNERREMQEQLQANECCGLRMIGFTLFGVFHFLQFFQLHYVTMIFVPRSRLLGNDQAAERKHLNGDTKNYSNV